MFSGVVNRSYAYMFVINSTLLVIAIVYTYFRMEWRTTDRQSPWRESNNMFTDIFDKNHFIQTVKTITKKRPLHKRMFIAIFIIMMGLYTFQRGEILLLCNFFE